MEGKFITFEGIDGSGKTSVLKGVIEHLNGKKIENYIWTREPGGNRISEAIRKIILNVEYTEMDARTEALLYAAARRQHLVDTVLPALKRGGILSTFAPFPAAANVISSSFRADSTSFPTSAAVIKKRRARFA